MKLFPATPRELAKIANDPGAALEFAVEMLTNIACGHSYELLDFHRRLVELAYVVKGCTKGVQR